MEMSALLAVAELHSLPAASLLVVSDKHVLDEESPWHGVGQNLTHSCAQALKLFLEFIQKHGDTEQAHPHGRAIRAQ